MIFDFLLNLLQTLKRYFRMVFMLMKYFIHTCILCFNILIFTSHVCTADPAASNHNSIYSNPILKHSVSIDEDPVSLNTLLNMLSKDGIQLKAKGYIGHLKLQMHLVNQPIYQIMKALATLVPGSWAAGVNPNSYYFYESPKALHSEHVWWYLYDKAVVRLDKDWQKHLDLILTQPYNLIDSNSDISQAEAASQNAMNFPMRTFYTHLPSSIKQQIINSHQSSLSTHSQVQMVGAAPIAVAFSQLSPNEQARYLDGVTEFQKSGTSQIKKYLDTNPLLCFSTLGVLYAFTVAPDGSSQYVLQDPDDAASNRWYLSLDSAAAKMDQSKLLYLIKREPKKCDDLDRELAIYQMRNVWNNNTPEKRESSKEKYVKQNIHLSPETNLMYQNQSPYLRSELLTWLANETGMQFLSDYYSRPEKPMTISQMHAPLKSNLSTVLDHIERTNDCSWKKNSDGIVLVRDNRWYRDDRLEIPISTITKWVNQLPTSTLSYYKMAAHKKQLHAALITQLNIAEAAYQMLSNYQIEYGLRYFVRNSDHTPFNPFEPAYVLRPFARTTMFIETSEPFMAFFNSLSDDERSLLEKHQLLASNLSSRQALLAIHEFPPLY